jgi:lipopolysaccharide/colanic/teichoic acid biosynthesis glycosyltransferase
VKRTFDCAVALVALMLAAPLLALIALIVTVDSPGPIIFRHRRVGRGFRPIDVWKFRTMRHAPAEKGAAITCGDNDPRITRVGRLLRRTKLDELPQLWNVLKGDMSLVGPRPEVAEMVELFHDDYETILKVRPGITDPASIVYRDEGAILAREADPTEAYVRRILPDKIRLAKQYVGSSSVSDDLMLLLRTVASVLGFRKVST